jgi:hypothetical protein
MHLLGRISGASGGGRNYLPPWTVGAASPPSCHDVGFPLAGLLWGEWRVGVLEPARKLLIQPISSLQAKPCPALLLAALQLAVAQVPALS